ncbi:STAS domain-containing protein [Gramella sp. AN32]|uniref:STAS domain-containing protein n=1 Tax=Christiangramia antarctica TaxID=2058158 RepID=A0ABW5X9Z1_9FLAO|nr:STAS domain-containing protein [Gramella sp. AN32]MCM4156443.1 hypothetical protein [Gramella sp. AN32]
MSVLNSTGKILEIKGKLYCGNVTETQQQIEYALEIFNNVIINLNSVSSMDISGIFMLYLLIVKAKEKKKEILFHGLDNQVIKTAMSIAGVKRIFVEAA